MAKQPRSPSYQLTYEDAIVVHEKIAEGWLQSRIAAFFDVNGGRISEVNTGLLHPGSYDDFVRYRSKAA